MAAYSGKITLETIYKNPRNAESAWEDHISEIVFSEWSDEVRSMASSQADASGKLDVITTLNAADAAEVDDAVAGIKTTIMSCHISPDVLDDPEDARAAGDQPAVRNVLIGHFELVEDDEDA